MTDGDTKEPTTGKPAKLSNAAKREGVMAALKADPAKSDRELARQCGVSHTYVSRLRAELNGNVSSRKAKSGGNVAARPGVEPGNVAKPGADVVGGNVSKAAANVAGNVSSVEDPRVMFLNLGAKLADDARWLREACEMLLATKPKRTKPESTVGLRGMGVIRAHEAINCLKRIPKDDGLRKRGFQVVADWLKHNK